MNRSRGDMTFLPMCVAPPGCRLGADSIRTGTPNVTGKKHVRPAPMRGIMLHGIVRTCPHKEP
jgi:hypothetical protein